MISMKFDVVLQGPIYSWTNQVIDEYLKCDWVSNIYVSTWEQSDTLTNCTMIFNTPPAICGVGNRNKQLVSSLEGVKRTETEFCIKARTDQIILDLPLIKEFFDQNNPNLIFTLGMYKTFPFHPKDHLFMGKRENLLKLFSAPHCTYTGPVDYNLIDRAETAIGKYYYALRDARVNKFIAEPLTYLVDNAPCREEAMSVDFEVRGNLFIPFPRIKMNWPKYLIECYSYELRETLGEYWS